MSCSFFLLFFSVLFGNQRKKCCKYVLADASLRLKTLLRCCRARARLQQMHNSAMSTIVTTVVNLCSWLGDCSLLSTHHGTSIVPPLRCIVMTLVWQKLTYPPPEASMMGSSRHFGVETQVQLSIDRNIYEDEREMSSDFGKGGHAKNATSFTKTSRRPMVCEWTSSRAR